MNSSDKQTPILYTLLQGMYWASYCTLVSFSAVYLQYRGLSNTLVGIVTGAGAACSVVASPWIATLVSRIKNMTVKKLIRLVFLISGLIYLAVMLLRLPVPVMMAGYIVMIMLYHSLNPLINAMAMSYVSQGISVNFGFARGVGSLAYALSSVLLGRIAEVFYPGALSYLFLGSIVILFGILFFMQEQKTEGPCIFHIGKKKERMQKHQEKTWDEKHRGACDAKEAVTVWNMIKNNPCYLFLLSGFALDFVSKTVLSTYLINIIRSLGGTETTLGLAMFVSAASEIPVMFLASVIMKRFRCITLLKISSVFFVLKNAAVFFAGGLPLIFMGMALQSFSYGVFTFAAVYYVKEHLEEKYQVLGQSMIGIMTVGIGGTAGNMLGGIVQDRLGLGMMIGGALVLTVIGMLIVFIAAYLEETSRHMTSRRSITVMK